MVLAYHDLGHVLYGCYVLSCRWIGWRSISMLDHDKPFKGSGQGLDDHDGP